MVVVEERRIVGMDLDGSILWTKNMSAYVTDFAYDGKRMYFGTLFGDLVCTDHDGNTLWDLTDDMELNHLKIDRNGDLLIVYTKWSYQTGSGTSYLRKILPQGEVRWTVGCPYSDSRPTLDKDNDIVMGGLGDLVQFAPNGTRMFENVKEWWIRRCDIVLMDERTMLVRDFEQLKCYVAIPCFLSISGSQRFGNEMRIDLGIEWTYDDHPMIEEIVLIRSDSKGEKEIHLSAGTRRYIEKGPSTETFTMKLVLILEDGTRIEGPSMEGIVDERPLDYVAVGLAGGCCSVTVFGVILTVVLLLILRRKKEPAKE
jgi:hypothetical protein